MGIMQHSTSKKIDVDDLKGRLAEQIRRDKYSHTYQAPSAEITLKRAKKSTASSGRAKSPLGGYGQHSNSDILNHLSPDQSNAATVKMYGQEDTTPVWYKSLKKNIK